MHAIFSVHPSAIGFSILSAPRLTVSGPISYGATVSRISQTSLEAPGFSKRRLASRVAGTSK
jgi:hypothetical protein